MPWKETCALDQRTQFIAAVLANGESITELCRRFGISRRTGYKWLTRYREEGFTGLLEHSRARRTQAHATPEPIVELVLAARMAHPTWGPRKLRAFLSRKYPSASFPSPSTIGGILKRNGLVSPRRRRKRANPTAGPLGDPQGSNESWSIDFKGQFRLEDRKWCYPLTLLDGHSRYLLCCRGLQGVRTEGVWPVMESLFMEYGLPASIRSDNGAPFAGVSFTGLTQLSAWWVMLGIRLERIQPGNPQQNGRLERLHRTLKAETTLPAASSMLAQQRRFDAFQQEYNEDRPHESLENETPAMHYRRSQRQYTRTPPEPEYPPEAELRKVDTVGVSRFHGLRVSTSQALAGQTVGFVPVSDHEWQVRFYNHLLGTLDERAQTLSNGVITRSAAKRVGDKRRRVVVPMMRGHL